MGPANDQRSERRYTPAQLCVAALALLMAGCSDAVGPTRSTAPPPRSPEQPGDPSNPAAPPSRSLARITGRVAFVSTRDGSPWIYVADSTGVRRLAPGDEPAWSPDGSTIAYESLNGISLMSADGSNERIIRRGGSQPSWSPDGKQIAFSDGGIRVMRSDGSFDRLLVDNAFIQRGDDMQRPAWSKDGQRIAFVRYDCCWMDPVAIYTVALDGTPPQAVMNGVIQNGGTLFSHWSPAWAPDGRSMAFIHNFELATIGVNDGALKFFGIRAAFESDLDWSPDGTRLVFSDYNGVQNWTPPFTGHLRLYVAVLATGEVQRLIPEASAPADPSYWDNHAVWSQTAP